MSAKIPPARRFPKRLSQQELKDKTTKYMNDNGADNHYKAQYYLEAANLVVGMKDPKFFTLQPNTHHTDYKNQAWNIVYQLVLQFLEENNMKLTIDTITKECGSAGLPKNDSDIGSVDDYMERLLDISESLASKQFQARVAEWKAEDAKGLQK
ncbi:hypothetical protein TVAG_403410 [Trichomonas vaginalis G3]|uniref:Uncharacterized protein n=1 Tax=Trichomonas vaginalis (strain ATCC PRA-98 / G3) TaxID=412133 RepID=A2F8X7_TRIV3|nr:hypothetical protein TVAGG3_0689030 [Trichomonas vaginalis G3]EAX98659.1 hypothetical protein TVAG_403410 [Trichomonas vaginalis G3]KAI5508427.1 hypothetical protein TVAGG3_0689030 [Trichomonas vaginalis G3]|eukprot:XP_001311589.1 hypothetical protein [Trichomonas vaginalis G3]